MKYFLFIFIFLETPFSFAQTTDTICIQSNEETYFNKRNLNEPKVGKFKVSWQLNHYFKKSTINAYYVIVFRLGKSDVTYMTYEGLVLKGKYEGIWKIKNGAGEIISTHEFLKNKFNGEQVYYDSNHKIQSIDCINNEIVNVTRFDKQGEPTEIYKFSNNKLISEEFRGLNPEFKIRSNQR